MRRFAAAILILALLFCSCYSEPDAGNPFPFSFSVSFSQNNAESGRPYEDAFYAHGTAFVVADGVSRTDTEYLEMTESPPPLPRSEPQPSSDKPFSIQRIPPPPRRPPPGWRPRWSAATTGRRVLPFRPRPPMSPQCSGTAPCSIPISEITI